MSERTKWLVVFGTTILIAIVGQLAFGDECNTPGTFCNGNTCIPAPEQQPWHQRGKAFVRVVCLDADGGFSIGTGGYIGDGMVLTAKHNIRDARQIKIQDGWGRWHPVTEVSRDPEADLALLKTCRLEDRIVPFTIASTPAVGARVAIGGFPFDRRYQLYTPVRLRQSFVGLDAYSVAVQQGVSGAPVAYQQQLVGIVSAASPQEQFTVAVQPSCIRRFISRVLGPRFVAIRTPVAQAQVAVAPSVSTFPQHTNQPPPAASSMTDVRPPVVSAAAGASTPSPGLSPSGGEGLNRCDCAEQFAYVKQNHVQLAASVANLAAIVEKMQQQAEQTTAAASANATAIQQIKQHPPADVDLSAVEQRITNLAARVGELEQRKIQLEIRNNGELVGTSEGRSVVGFDVQSVFKESQDGSN